MHLQLLEFNLIAAKTIACFTLASGTSLQAGDCHVMQIFDQSSLYTIPNEDSHTDRVAVGDIDNDGDLDLAFSDWQTKYIVFYTNDGLGSFSVAQEMVPFSVPGLQWKQIFLRDMNNDGFVDLVEVSDIDRKLRVTMNQGDGTFIEPVSYSVTGVPTSLVLADLDEDGDLDYAYPDLAADSIRVMWNSGDGSPEPRGGLISTAERPFGLLIDDFNNDGIPDIAASGQRQDEVAVHMNEGAFSIFKPSYYDVDNDPDEMISGDFDNDGNIDIVTLNTGWNVQSVSLLRGNGDGSFRPQESIQLVSKPKYASPADIDSDGDLDIVATYQYSTQSPTVSVVVLENDGQGNFQEPKVVGTPEVGFAHFAVGDFDGNSTPDLVSIASAVEPVSFGVYFNPCPPRCLADLNGDDSLDFFDVSAFLVAYANADPIADTNGDGEYDFFDVAGFIAQYNEGC